MKRLASSVLLPAPRMVESRPGEVVVPFSRTVDGPDLGIMGFTTSPQSAWIQRVADSSLAPEAYRLSIDPRGLTLASADDQGARHGLRTLGQLLSLHGRCLPCGVIEDAPAFAIRGVLLDISRDRIPTMAEFRRIIAQLASWKINHLQLYVEHTVAYAGHEEVWRDLDPLTPAEIRELDVCCAAQGIALAANQNCFGHLAAWFKHPRYAPLAEISPEGSWDFNGLVTRQGGFSLCPGDPRSFALVQDWLGQLLPLHTAPVVNIGCDETFDVGQGRSKDLVAARGRTAIWADFTAQVCAEVARHGKRPSFWADIALEHPEALAALPRDTIGLAWSYEADAPFERWVRQLTSLGLESWVCPGTSSWRSITGRTGERQANLLSAAQGGLAAGATGFLVCDWGDLGHRQQWPIALHGLAEAAHRAWSGTAPYDPNAGAQHAFGCPELGPWLDRFGAVDAHFRAIGGRTPGAPLRNATALFTDLHHPLGHPWIGNAGDWANLGRDLGYLRDALPEGLDQQIGEELHHAWRVALAAATRASFRRAGNSAALREMTGHWRDLTAEHRQLWLRRSRPRGLAASCRHYDLVADACSTA